MEAQGEAESKLSKHDYGCFHKKTVSYAVLRAAGVEIFFAPVDGGEYE